MVSFYEQNNSGRKFSGKFSINNTTLCYSYFVGVKTVKYACIDIKDYFGRVYTSYKIFVLASLKISMNDFREISYLVINIIPIIPVYGTCVDIGYKYNYQMVL